MKYTMEHSAPSNECIFIHFAIEQEKSFRVTKEKGCFVEKNAHAQYFVIILLNTVIALL